MASSYRVAKAWLNLQTRTSGSKWVRVQSPIMRDSGTGLTVMLTDMLVQSGGVWFTGWATRTGWEAFRLNFQVWYDLSRERFLRVANVEVISHTRRDKPPGAVDVGYTSNRELSGALLSTLSANLRKVTTWVESVLPKRDHQYRGALPIEELPGKYQVWLTSRDVGFSLQGRRGGKALKPVSTASRAEAEAVALAREDLYDRSTVPVGIVYWQDLDKYSAVVVHH